MEVDAVNSTPRPKSTPTSTSTSKPGPGGPTDNIKSPSTLHDIILDYITHSAYLDTARDLAAVERNVDADVDADVDMTSADAGESRKAGREGLSEQALESIEKRYNIMNSILDGAIARAIEALNAHYPLVLSGPGSPRGKSTTTNGHTNGFSISNGSAGGASTSVPTNGHLSTTTASTNGATATATTTVADHTRPSFETCCTPSHVLLNLHIQQFIESFRNLAPAPPSSSSAFSSPSSSFHGSQSWGADSSTGTLQHALTAASGLHAEAGRLADPADRAVYVREITEAGALFAYSDPEASPVGGFLKQERRIRLAQQVNRAILRSLGSSTTSWLEQIARRTTASLSILDSKGISPEPLPANDQLSRLWKVGERQFRLSDFVAQNHT